MNLFRSMNISATGIQASRLRMETASLNLANAESASSDPNQVYQPRRVTLSEAIESLKSGFPQNREVAMGVHSEVELQANRAPIALHDPSHPDADAEGMVLYPDVDLSGEMTEMMAARRAYEAGLAAYTQSKETFISTLEIIRG